MEAPTPAIKLENGSASGSEERGMFGFCGWVYHLGVNSIGHEYCHLRFLCTRGKYVFMYKRDPSEHPGIKPIRQGVVGPTLMVEELGRRKVNNTTDLYVLRFYNRLEETQKGEIACLTAGEVKKWMEAFDHAKQQAEYELSRGASARDKLNMEAEINLEGRRRRVRRYAHELRRLIRIGHGPEALLRQSSKLLGKPDGLEGESGDAIEAHKWKCVRTLDGIRIFEDVSDYKSGKGALAKATGVIDATADTVFEVLLNTERQQRYEWDMLTGDLELVESYDGHYDLLYGTYEPKYLTRWQSKRDFVLSRQWFLGQDGTYTILQFPAVHKRKPPRSGFRRTKINPSTWELRNLNTPMGSSGPKCVVTHTLEIHSASWCRWKNNQCSKFEKSIPYALLCQVAGLKEYIGANPALVNESATTFVHSKGSDVSISSHDYDDTDVHADVQEEFYDAIAVSSDEDSDVDDEDPDQKAGRVKLKNISWAIAGMALQHPAAPDVNKELDPSVNPITIDPSDFPGSLHLGKDEKATNCWTSPSGAGFKIRGKNYLKDNSKVVGGDPLLKLIAVDWFKIDKSVDKIALHPRCLVQSEAGKKLPFILVINLQVPAKPNYSMVIYFASDRPIKEGSLLAKFVDGNDMFRDSRFKLIPSIIEGYWMVKRAVGTKACLLGKAVTCKYFRQDNFLEIDVDIGSSSVARSVMGLVLGYVTSLVVDLAILIEMARLKSTCPIILKYVGLFGSDCALCPGAKEESELPEYLLGTARLNRVRLDTAVPLDV